MRFNWAEMDEWLEEDEPVYTHPRDPYTRVDILASSQHVRVEIDGVTVADSVRPHILFETHLPPRYYLPLPDVRTELLVPSDTTSHCPYKGTAGYWSVDAGHGVHPDLVWIYRTPLPESQKVAGLACFYNEKVDLYLDGELQERPRTALQLTGGRAARGPHMPDGFISWCCARPIRCAMPGASVTLAAWAVCMVVLKVAPIATPCPFSVTVTGLVRPKFWHARLVKDMLSRLARNVSRLSPTFATGG